MGYPITPGILAIGGSDSSGGAGIQADLKAIHANGGYALTVVTSVTAQNTRSVDRIFALPADMVAAQMETIAADIAIAAIKTGMLQTPGHVQVVAQTIARWGSDRLVVDPVISATTGSTLQSAEATSVMIERLLPLARVCTPNANEAEALSGVRVHTRADAEEAARRIQALGPRAVVITGGHLADDKADEEAADLLLDGNSLCWLVGARIADASPHGAGCTFAATLATHLGRGFDLYDSAAHAKEYVTQAIAHTVAIGGGHPPLNHFFSVGAG